MRNSFKRCSGMGSYARRRSVFGLNLHAVLLCIAHLGVRAPARAEPVPAGGSRDGLLSEPALFDLLAGELMHRLSSSNRFALLPSNVSLAHVSTNQAPVFAMVRGDPHRTAPLAETTAGYVRDLGGFRLMVEGSVAGVSSDGETVITDRRGSQGAVVSARGSRPVDLPNGLNIRRAFRIGGRWLFMTSAGLLREGATVPVDGTQDLAEGATAIETGRELVLFPSRRRQPTGDGAPWVLAVLNSSGVGRREFTSGPPGNIQGVVCLEDGNWLAVGERIAVLGPRERSAPTDGDRTLPQGYQQYDGWQIARPVLLRQRGADEITLLLTFLEQGTHEPRQGIFRLGRNGRLRLLCGSDHGGGGALGNCALLADGWGTEWIHVPGQGLARVGDSRLIWVDRSGRMQSMHAALGCDDRGHLYFAQSTEPLEHGAETRPLLWVYRPGSLEPAGSELALLPTTARPVSDSSGRIWFIHDRFRGGYRPGRDGSGPSRTTVGSDLLDKAGDRPLTWPEAALDLTPGADAGYDPTLYCYADGRCHRCLTHRSLRNAVLAAGSDGVVFVIPAQTSQPTLVIDDGVVTAGSNLHALAESDFARLLRVAPDSTGAGPCIGPWESPHGLMTSICRVNGMLWISQGGRTEVYRNGKSLFVDKRLALLSGRAERGRLLGPLTGTPPRMLLMTRSDALQDLFWATPAERGIVLERAVEPPSDWPGGGRLTSPGHLEALPLPAPATGRVYYYNGFERVWESSGPDSYASLPDAGRPVLVTSDGRLIVYRHMRTYQGYRIVSASSGGQDIRPTYARVLRVVREEPGGRLMCLGPEGIVWLRRDATQQYALDAETPVRAGVRLREFIAESANEVCLLAADGAGMQYIAAWRRNAGDASHRLEGGDPSEPRGRFSLSGAVDR